jgi:uncharacterized membrane protein YhaH (DUF805 family)
MNWGNYLFGFEGRINRAKWWLFLPIAIVYMIVLWFVILGMGVGLWLYLALHVPLWYMGTAVSVKRYHDRNQPALLALIYPGIYIATTVYSTYVAWGATAAAAAALTNLTPESMQAAQAAAQSAAAGMGGMYWVLSLLQLASGVFALVNLGILKGTTGDNQYGPDPLPAGHA